VRRRFGAHRVSAPADVLDESLSYVLGSGPVPPRWCWNEPIVDVGGLRSDADGGGARGMSAMSRMTPRVAIQTHANGSWTELRVDGRVEDDDGLRIVALAGPPRDGASCWCAYWMPPASAGQGARYRFAVTRAGGERACVEASDCSPAFSPAAPPASRCPS
jgi:hypothetical protein